MRAILMALVVVAGRTLGAQAALTPLELNRRGEWAEAAHLAEQMLAPGHKLGLTEQCETRFSLAYAYSQTSRRPAALQEAQRVLRECASLTNHWALGEADKLRAGLIQNGLSVRAIDLDDGWKTGDAGALGLDTTALAAHRTLCDTTGADACLVAYRGQIVQEWYSPRYAEPIYTMSSVKSWTALLTGLLIADEKLALDDPVAKWIPEWRAGAEGGVTVRHLLTMTSGLPDLRARGQDVGSVSDKNTFAFSLQLAARPGARWAYVNNGAYLLSPILERAAGMPLQSFATARLFTPLRMRHTTLHVDGLGRVWTHADAETTLRDFAKICQLALDGGRWQGVQVVPEAWMRTVTQPIPQNPGYGMLWWLAQDPVIHATRGANNTNCYAMPELGLVVARMQANVRPSAGGPFEEWEGLNPQVRALFKRIAGRPTR